MHIFLSTCLSQYFIKTNVLKFFDNNYFWKRSIVVRPHPMEPNQNVNFVRVFLSQRKQGQHPVIELFDHSLFYDSRNPFQCKIRKGTSPFMLQTASTFLREHFYITFRFYSCEIFRHATSLDRR